MSQTQPNPYAARPTPQGNDDNRQLFIAGDIKNIPYLELRPMCSNVLEWLLAGVLFKICRIPSPAQFATESRRLVRVSEENVPRRLMNHFHELRPQAERLGFEINHFATVPAIGPIAIALMTMSEKSGQSCFYAVQVALKMNDQINDEGHFGFNTSLSGDAMLTTLSPVKLPKPRKGLQRKILKSRDVAEVYRVHQERMRDQIIQAVPPDQLFALAEKHNRLEADDLQQRRITRLATPGEITRLRSQR